mgnify:CR=1 FL=1
MSPEQTILLSILVPFLGAALIALTWANPNIRETITLITGAILFYLVSSIYPVVAGGAQPSVILFEMLPGLAIAFTVEPLGMIFAAIASFLWIITTVYSIGYMRANNEHKQTRFYACFAIALAATMGVAFNMLDDATFIAHGLLEGHDKGRVLAFCRTLTPNVRLVDDYMADDFTVFLR